MMMATRPRVEAVMRQYALMSEAQQAVVRSMVDCAYRRLMAECLESSVPFKVPVGMPR